MAKMNTIKKLAVGTYAWDKRNKAHIERNLFAKEGEAWEALRFCKTRNGRHNRVHLVIEEANFVKLFEDAVKQGVFSEETLRRMADCLRGRVRRMRWAEPKGEDPFQRVIGIGSAGGRLTQNLDEELYGDSEA